MEPTTELKMSGLTVAGIFGVRADKGLVPITGSSPMCLLCRAGREDRPADSSETELVYDERPLLAVNSNK